MPVKNPDEVLIRVEEILRSKHSDADKPGFQHHYDIDCPACTARQRALEYIIASQQ